MDSKQLSLFPELDLESKELLLFTFIISKHKKKPQLNCVCYKKPILANILKQTDVQTLITL